MTVRRYRDVSEMEEVPWRSPGDPELFRAIAAAWAFWTRTCRPRFPPGVYRHRSIEDAERLRESWERENVRRLRAERGRGW